MEREEEKFFDITYASTGMIVFACECGTQLTITRRSPSSIMSGVFCQACGEQWYVRWSDGILRRGRIGDAVKEA